MPKEDDNSQPLGICHRIINFITNNLISQGFKRVTPGRAASLELNEVPLKDSFKNLKKNVWPSNSNGQGASEIVIEFRHVEGPENMTPVQKLGSPVYFPKKNGLIVTDDRALLLQKEDAERKERRHFDAATSSRMVRPPQETDATVRWITATQGRGGPKSIVDMRKNTPGDTEKCKNKEKNTPNETTSSEYENEGTRMNSLRHPRPLLMRVASNINEKADAYIQSRKEAMNKHYSSELKKL